MSWEAFDDQCPGCRPCLIDATTRQPVPDDTPIMQAVLRIWQKTTRLEREAFHRVTCLNSRQPTDLLIIQSLGQRIHAVLRH
jgi:hypothetical protein